MGNSQPQATRSGSSREIARLVGVLVLVAVATVGTYWVRARSTEATAEAAAPVTPTAPAVPARPRAVAPAPTHAESVHADIYFDFKSTRLRAEAARLLQETAAGDGAAGDLGGAGPGLQRSPGAGRLQPAPG